MEFDLIAQYINYINQTYYFFIQCFIDGGKAKCVESLVFNVRGQAREGGMQVLQQCHFVPQGQNVLPFGLLI